MNTSDAGIKFIGNWEGLRLTKYKDIVGKWTIGYGHLIKLGENYTTITQEQALEILRSDLGIAEGAVKKYITVSLNQNQFDALVSFAFNLGSDILNPAKHTLSAALNKGDYVGAANQFVLYDHAGGGENQGLKNRRLSEKNLFLSPIKEVIKDVPPVVKVSPAVEEVSKTVENDIPPVETKVEEKPNVEESPKNDIISIILNIIKSLFKI